MKVADATISREKNAIDSFSFTAYPIYGENENALPELSEMKTLITVQNTVTGKYHFRGRVLKVTPQMGADGALCKKVVCEGEMAYLCDTVQPYTEPTQYSDSTSGGVTTTGLQKFIDFLLANHNSNIENYKKIYRGIVDLQTYQTSGGVYKGTSWESTWDILQEKLVKVFGGELRLRHESNGLYLDYRAACGTTQQTAITFGDNLQSIVKTVDATNVVTRIIPLGYKIEETSEETIYESGKESVEKRLTIESVNNGCPWIESASAALLYGIQYKTVIWDDVTTPQNLYSKGLAYLQEQNSLLVSHEISAVDVSFLGAATAELELYDKYPVSNPALGISETLEIVRIVTKLAEPFAPQITMGDVQIPLSGITGDDVFQTNNKFKSFYREIYHVGYQLKEQFQAANGELLARIQRVENSVEDLDESVKISATSQFFTKASGATAFSPSSITLTANCDEAINTFQWYKDGTIISGATYQTLSISDSAITEKQAVFKCVVTDDIGSQFYDQITIAKISDGEKGETGNTGAQGADGYTVLLSNEFISIPVDTARKPKTSQNVSCVVSVYRGATALTPVQTNPSYGQFKVIVTNSVSGVSISQNTAGTLVLAFSSESAIPNIVKLNLSIITGDIILSANIQISAEMMDYIISHESRIKELDDKIELEVSQTTYAQAIPTYSETDQTMNWTAAEKAANVGFLWYDTANNKMKRWSGAEWTDVTAQNASTWASYMSAQITVLAGSIEQRVEKNGIVNAINLSTEGARIDAGKLDLYGKMSVYTGRYGASGTVLAGYLGYGQSNISSDWGIMLQSDEPNTGEVIATENGARISYNGTASQIYAAQTQAGINAPTVVLACTTDNTGKVTAGYSGASLTYGNTDADNQYTSRVWASSAQAGMKAKSILLYAPYENGGVMLRHAHTTASNPNPTPWSVYWCGGGSGVVFAPDTEYASLGVSTNGAVVDGATLYRWQNIYTKNVYNSAGVIISSDNNLKCDISYDLSRYAGLLDALKPASYKYLDGDSGRTHTGLIAQDLLEAMIQNGLETTDFAAYVYNPDSGECGIRYDELIPLLIMGYQKSKAKIDVLEGMLSDYGITGSGGV